MDDKSLPAASCEFSVFKSDSPSYRHHEEAAIAYKKMRNEDILVPHGLTKFITSYEDYSAGVTFEY